jgi:hypothetical protein
MEGLTSRVLCVAKFSIEVVVVDDNDDDGHVDGVRLRPRIVATIRPSVHPRRGL